MNLIRKSNQNSGGNKTKTITKLFDRFMNKKEEHWNDKGITTTLTAPSTRTVIGRKILRRASVKKLINKCGCFKNCDVQQEANAIFEAQELYWCIY